MDDSLFEDDDFQYAAEVAGAVHEQPQQPQQQQPSRPSSATSHTAIEQPAEKPTLVTAIPPPLSISVGAAAGETTTPSSPEEISWETVPNAAFDEVVACIILDPVNELDSLASVFIRREADGSTLLHVVAGWANCQELVARLLDAGIPPDATDTSGWTPLLEAAQEGQIPICEVLLANGATPDLALDQLTPLRAAAEVGNEETTQWLLQQPGTWPGVWDTAFFAFLLAKTPGAVATYLDRFAVVLNHSKKGFIGVRYSQLRYIYGEPHVPVEETPLAMVVQSALARDLLSHRVMKYLLKAKWKSFARAKFRREFSAYALLLVSYYVPTIFADPDWIELQTAYNYWVAVSRVISWVCCVYLLVKVEMHEFLGDSVRNYFLSFWNWLNIITYVATVVSIPIELQGSSLGDIRNSVLALITVSLWVNLLQFLQVSTESGLLIAMMSNMVKDVYRFLLLYTVFIFGYSGAFYILLRGQTGYESFTNSFITVFLMLFGAIDYSVFSDKSLKGWLWHMGNFLLVTHLVAVVIVLLNILIAMMATTYADVWDSAEAEALQSHALAIIRMEKSLQKSERTAKYLALLKPPVAAKAAKSTPPGPGPGQAPSLPNLNGGSSHSSQDLLTSRSAAKRAITQGVLSKLNSLPLAADAKSAVTRALARSVQLITPGAKMPKASNRSMAMVHPDVESSSPVLADVNVQALAAATPPLPRIRSPRAVFGSPRAATASMAASAFIEHLIDPPTLNLNALEQTLFLKSAFDDDAGGALSSMGCALATLDDGIRYELPVKKAKEEQHQLAIRELQSRVEQLTKVVVELHALQMASGEQGDGHGRSTTQLKRRLPRGSSVAGGLLYARTPKKRPSEKPEAPTHQ